MTFILAAQRGKIEKNKKPEIVSIPKMLRDLRRAESDSELVFILTEKDILFLVQNVWDSRSAISYSDEVNDLSAIYLENSLGVLTKLLLRGNYIIFI